MKDSGKSPMLVSWVPRFQGVCSVFCFELWSDIPACLWGYGFEELEKVDMAGSSGRRDQECMGWCWLCPGSQEACLEAVSVVSSLGGRAAVAAR